MGTSGKLEEAVKEILDSKDSHRLDFLFCNGKPVFQAVNIGDVFALTEAPVKRSFVQEVVNFLKNLKKLPSLTHRSFRLSSDEEKIVLTSALGMIVVEHPLNSVVSKRLISKSATNDGMFHVLILSPQNVFELFWFLLRSLMPRKKPMDVLPSFIGQIKAPYLKIENETAIDFTVDGLKNSAEVIILEVKQEALLLKQKSIYATEENGGGEKKSFKTEKLPKGELRDELTKRKLPILPRATTEEFQELFKVLRENAKVSSPFVVMMILSAVIATFGLFGNSSPVIIGAMILAPIISPIVSFSMGMVRYDTNMLKKGIITILIGTLVALTFAAVVSLMIPLKVLTPEIDARLSPTLLDLGIAVASGIAAAYAHAKEEIAKSLAGVAIAVALVPPLAVAGIGIGWWSWEVFSGAFLLYLTNMAGIILFAGITFLLLGFAPFKRARMGLVYTLLIVILVMIPLSLSFNRIQEEAAFTNILEKATFDKVVLRNVKVRLGTPLRVSVRLVGSSSLKDEDIKRIKNEIEEELGEEIILEVVTAIEF
ncbi:TIGR00341 family protein [Antarcticibacterium sp. 1MA-6-2]|uniref:TIGR00341 family protein n=1 Tax=Antarcticibacterium sp. 1MA-6-2 TaxID=2908210 RepID=UPI001F22039B|nr:TIGR00341 family protein [Antarcticibacterium sp. 1MA-6-2]UJH91217.1 TIGR00341 family protein [Antarcticibacterium sp. 1MA-6-2]